MAKKEKTKHYRILILNEDFGNNKKGESLRCETSLAARLIDKGIAIINSGNISEVAVIEKVKEIKVKQPKENKKK